VSYTVIGDESESTILNCNYSSEAVIPPRTKEFNGVQSAGKILDTKFNVTLVSFCLGRQH
jgi:hypothetical protein